MDAAIDTSATLNALILFRSGYVCINSKWANERVDAQAQAVLPRELQPIGGLWADWPHSPHQAWTLDQTQSADIPKTNPYPLENVNGPMLWTSFYIAL